MSITVHERPGVYSTYDIAGAVTAGAARKVVGIAARAADGTANVPVKLFSTSEGLDAFGADSGNAKMMRLLSLLFANGAGTVEAVAVGGSGALADYSAAFDALRECEDVGVVICDSEDVNVHKALRDSVAGASQDRCERIAVVGSSKETVSDLQSHAAQINHERVVFAAPKVCDETGTLQSGMLAAAALAAVIAGNDDPARPLNGAALAGFTGVSRRYSDTETDTLVQSGVTILETFGGTVSPMRAVTTKTTTDGVSDTAWREVTTVLIADDVISDLRTSLRRRFLRSKNNARSRAAIRSEVLVALEEKKQSEIIDDYAEVRVTPDANDPTLCLVEFGFTVTHGISRIHLTAHIAV